MFDFTQQFFYYKLLFMVELIVGECFFAVHMARRDHFAARMVCSCAALMLVAFCIPVPAYNVVVISGVFFTLFLCSVIAMFFCLRTSVWNILFCAVAGYAMRHFAYVVFISLNDIVFYALGIVTGISTGFDPYGAPLLDILSSQSIISVILYLFSYFIVFWAGKFIYADRVPSGDLMLAHTSFIAIAAIMLFTDVVLTLVTQYNAAIDDVSLVVERIYNALSCILALQLLFSNIFQQEARKKLSSVEQLLHTQAKQYELAKKNIDIINIKCHDLKHQLRAWRENGMADEAELQEIESAVDIYQSAFQTGNEVLDIILTEKSLLCEKNQILLTCMADGAALRFLRPAEMYSLFGNAIDNAIEAVLKLPPEDRSIDLSVRREGNITGIRVENPYDGALAVQGGRIRTSKSDRDAHGFGLLSMQAIVEKHGGTMTIGAENRIFSLNILFFGAADRDAETTDRAADEGAASRS